MARTKRELLPETKDLSWFEIIQRAREAAGVQLLVLVVQPDGTQTFLRADSVLRHLEAEDALDESMYPLIHEHGTAHFPILRQYDDGYEVSVMYCAPPDGYVAPADPVELSSPKGFVN